MSDDPESNALPTVRKGQGEVHATSHDNLDRDTAVQEEVRNVARSLVNTVRLMHDGRYQRPDTSLRNPRPK
jgi:hypothetical protein